MRLQLPHNNKPRRAASDIDSVSHISREDRYLSERHAIPPTMFCLALNHGTRFCDESQTVKKMFKKDVCCPASLMKPDLILCGLLRKYKNAKTQQENIVL